MPVNPKSLKNLRPLKKGEKGRNPKGRPKKLPKLEELLADVLGETNGQGIEAAKGILMALRAKAAKGDVRAAELLLDRAYGKPKQTIDVNETETIVVDFRDAE